MIPVCGRVWPADMVMLTQMLTENTCCNRVATYNWASQKVLISKKFVKIYLVLRFIGSTAIRWFLHHFRYLFLIRIESPCQCFSELSTDNNQLISYLLTEAPSGLSQTLAEQIRRQWQTRFVLIALIPRTAEMRRWLCDGMAAVQSGCGIFCSSNMRWRDTARGEQR